MSTAITLNREIINSKSINAVLGVAFFAVATALGAYIRIPIPGTPVPITLQTFFVVLSGAVLGRRLGILSQASYLALGVIGLPVFQGCGFGMAHIFGPTGGYLAGFIAASFLVGKMLENETSNTYRIILSFAAGNAILYGFGIAWLMAIYRMSLLHAITIGLIPFLTAEAVKISAAAFVYRAIAKRSKSIFS